MPQKFRLKIATTSHLMNRYSIHEAVSVLGKIGYDAIEIWADDLEKQLASEKTSFEKIQNALFKNKMTGTVHGPTADHESPDNVKYNICAKDVKFRMKSIKKNLAALGYADRLGFSVVVVHPGHTDKADEKPDREYWDLQLDALKILSRYAERLKLDLAIELMENRGKEFVTEPKAMLKILKALKSKRAGVTVDITHAFTHGPEKPAEFIEALKKHIFHAHFSGQGERKTHVPFHMSTVPVKNLDAALEKLTRYHAGWITVEGHLKGIMDDTRENQKLAAAGNLEYVRREIISIHLI